VSIKNYKYVGIFLPGGWEVGSAFFACYGWAKSRQARPFPKAQAGGFNQVVQGKQP
jgi:hypothetical protein